MGTVRLIPQRSGRLRKTEKLLRTAYMKQEYWTDQKKETKEPSPMSPPVMSPKEPFPMSPTPMSPKEPFPMSPVMSPEAEDMRF